MNTPVGTSPPLPQLTTDTMGIPPNGFNDAQIIQQLLGSISQREALFAYLYRASGWRQWVLHHVSNNGGDVPAGEDVFQESLILFDRNIREKRFLGGSSLKTYFMGIAKQYWFNRQRRIHPQSMPANYEVPTSETPEFLALQTERQHLIDDILGQLGEQCKKVLELYKLSLSNEEIAQTLGLSSPELAKKYTYRCREKFRAFVMKRKDILEHLDIRPRDA